MAPSPFYYFIDFVNTLSFLNEKTKKRIMKCILDQKSNFLRDESSEELLVFLECCTVGVNFIIVEKTRTGDETPTKISELVECLGETLRSILLRRSEFNENAWDKLLELCIAGGATTIIYPLTKMVAVPDGLAGWIIKNSHELAIPHSDVRTFAALERLKNQKDLSLATEYFNFELKLATHDSFKELQASIYSAQLAGLKFLSYAYKKLGNFPELQKEIVHLVKNTRSMLKTDFHCRAGYRDIKSNKIPAEQVQTVINKCDFMYRDALIDLPYSEMHIFYLDFLNDLRKNGYIESVGHHYYQALQMDMLRSVEAVETEYEDFTEMVIRFFFTEGNVDAGKKFVTQAYGFLKDEETKLDFLYKFMDVPKMRDTELGLGEEYFCFAMNLRSKYNSEGIKAARRFSKQTKILYRAKPIFFKELLRIEKEQDPRSMKQVGICLENIIKNGTSNYADYLELIKFEMEKSNFSSAFKIYSQAMEQLHDCKSKLQLMTELSEDDIYLNCRDMNSDMT